ncbi:MAG: hypothetical protein J0L91_06580 [Burkholderiales bacterium]|nr:hypothetical protein [Burkholderiales bacterium]MCC7114890.1 hypothetical protein [Burkholderiales bacterium]
MRAPLIPCAAIAIFAAAAPAQAAPCHDVRGDWTFTLQCAALGPAPIFGARTLYATIGAQEGCTFTGTLSPVATGGGEPWVGALHGDQNRQVASDYAGAKATGELAERRRGLYREMTMTYTYSGGPNPTACTGVGVRAD